MNQVIYGIFDISIEVVCDEDLQPRTLFPSLHEMPRGDARGIVWHLDVRSVEHFPRLYHACTSAKRSLFMWPGLEIKWCEDPDGLYRASIPGAELTIDSQNKTASLSILKGSIAAAERMGRLAYTEILRYEKRYMVHAGALEIDGQAILILGPSGAGKSTMTTGLSALAVGRFIADDRCLLFQTESGLMVSGVSDFLMLTAPSHQLLSNSGIPFPNVLEQVKGKDAYNCHDVFINISRNACPVGASFILSLNQTVDDTTGETMDQFTKKGIMPMEAMAASKQILESGYYAGPAGVIEDHFKTMLCLATDYPSFAVPYRLHFGTLRDQLKSCLGGTVESHQAPESHWQYRSVSIPTPEKKLVTETLCAIISNSQVDPPHVDPTPTDPRPVAPIMRDLTPHQCWTLCKIAEHHELLPLIAKALFDSKKSDHNLSPYLENTLKLCLDAAQKFRRACLAFVSYTASLLGDFKGQWCVVHGPSVTERFARNPEVRPFHRLHLLVSPDISSAVIKYLRNKRLPSGQFVPQTIHVASAVSNSNRVDPVRNWQIVIHDQVDTLCHLDPGDLLNTDGALTRLKTIKTYQGAFPALSDNDQALISFLVSVEWKRWHRVAQLLDLVEIQGTLSGHMFLSLIDTLKSSVDYHLISNMLALARHIFLTPVSDRQKGELDSTTQDQARPDLDLLRFAALTPWEPLSRSLLETIK